MTEIHNYLNDGQVTHANNVRDIINNYNVASSSKSAKEKKVLFGYYESWSEYSTKPIEKFTIDDIQEVKLTHIAYAFISINFDGSVNLVDDKNADRFPEFLDLKRCNPDLKLLISLQAETRTFDEVFRHDAKLENLLSGLVELIGKFEFDGLDLVWVYPENRHKDLFTNLIAKLRETFRPPFILSAAISPDRCVADIYDLKKLEKHLDFFNILAYGLLTGEARAQHNAPMVKIKEVIREWIKVGADFSKILLGVELGGKKFTLKNPNNYEPGAECEDSGQLVKSFEIKNLQVDVMKEFLGSPLKCDDWKKVIGPRADHAYSYCDNIWISHENELTVRCKANFASKKKMAGVVVMALNYEGNAESPLLDAIYDELNKPLN